MKNTLWISLPAALCAALIAASCGGGQRDLCREKRTTCDSPLVCDQDDGLCKCGGRGGVVCEEGFSCDPVTSTCLSDKCVGVSCAEGTSCDVNDGTCKCGGTGGTVCAAGLACNPATKVCEAEVDCNEVACPLNQTCDTSTGQCHCGDATCAPGEFCQVESATTKRCVQNLCSGVSCAPNLVCDPNDGYCKCNGATCQSGQSCSCPGGADAGACADTARTCRNSSACLGVTCTGNTTCDPVDGKCKCGGPGGPVCSMDQICSLQAGQCQGGEQCQNMDGSPKLCSGGTSCDPEDGQCKCGGGGGVVCKDAMGAEPAEVCVANSLQQSCRRPCDPRSSDCAAGTFCYFDTTANTPVAYCAPNTDTRAEGTQCTTPTACFGTAPLERSLHCAGLAAGTSGICREYCDVGMNNCRQLPPHTCVPVTGTASTDVGYCQP